MNHAHPHPCSQLLLGGAAAAFVVLASIGAAHAGPVVILDRQFKPRVAEILSIKAGVVAYKDLRSGNAEREIRISEVSVIMDAEVWSASTDATGWRQRGTAGASAAERANLGILELVDGQRIIGSIDTASVTNPDTLIWTQRTIGSMKVDLERVRRVRMEGPAAIVPATIDRNKDAVLLSNGDVLSGFIERIGEGVSIKPSGGGGDLVTTLLTRVREIRLANPAKAPADAMLVLEGGSIVSVDLASLSGSPAPGGGLTVVGRALLVAEPQPTTLGQMRALVAQARSITALASLPIVKQEPDSDRFFGKPVLIEPDADAPLGLVDVELPGPMSVEWQLPAGGGGRIAGWLVLPESAREWGDCVVTLAMQSDGTDRKELLSQRLRGEEPVCAINIALPAGAASAKAPGPRLLVTVTAGSRGPIQNRVILRRMLVSSTPPE